MGYYKKKNNQQSVGEAVTYFLKRYGLEDRLDYEAIYAGWNKILGPTIANRTEKMKVVNGVLYVSLTSSVLRHQLMNHRERLVNELNEYAGKMVISDIFLK